MIVFNQAILTVAQVKMYDKKKEVSPLKWMRNRVGLRQTDLAQILGVSSITISSWETGRKEPELKIWQTKALCQALGVTLDELPDSFAPQRLSNDSSEG